MSIEAVLLIVILTFGFGSVLNRWEMRPGRLRRRRAGRPGLSMGPALRTDIARLVFTPDRFSRARSQLSLGNGPSWVGSSAHSGRMLALDFWRDNHTVEVIGLPVELKGRTY